MKKSKKYIIFLLSIFFVYAIKSMQAEIDESPRTVLLFDSSLNLQFPLFDRLRQLWGLSSASAESNDLQNVENDDTLHRLVISGDEVGASALLNKGYKVDVLDSKGKTALYYAVYYNKITIVKLLLCFGADRQLILNDGQIIRRLRSLNSKQVREVLLEKNIATQKKDKQKDSNNLLSLKPKNQVGRSLLTPAEIIKTNDPNAVTGLLEYHTPGVTELSLILNLALELSLKKLLAKISDDEEASYLANLNRILFLILKNNPFCLVKNFACFQDSECETLNSENIYILEKSILHVAAYIGYPDLVATIIESLKSAIDSKTWIFQNHFIYDLGFKNSMQKQNESLDIFLGLEQILKNMDIEQKKKFLFETYLSVKDKNGRSPLKLAMDCQRIKVAKLLGEYGAHL